MPSCSKPCVCGRGHRTGVVRGVSSHWANLVPLPKAREAFFLLLFTSLTLKAPYSYIPFLPTLSSRNSVFWRDELQPCICEVNELQNTSKEKERSTPLRCSSLWAPHSCEGAGVHQAPPAHGPVTQLCLGVAPCGDVGAALAHPGAAAAGRLSGSPFALAGFHAAGWRLWRGACRGGRSFKGFLVKPALLCGALPALLPVWVCYCTVAAPLRAALGGKAACAAGLCRGAGAGVAVAQFAAVAALFQPRPQGGLSVRPLCWLCLYRWKPW